MSFESPQPHKEHKEGPRDIVTKEPRESLNDNQGYLIIRNWDKTLSSLKDHPQLEPLVRNIGFDLDTFYDILSITIPKGLKSHEVKKEDGTLVDEYQSVETIVEGKPLELMAVTAYPGAATKDPESLGRLTEGGEVILITEGSSEMLLAPDHGKSIDRKDLVREKLNKGDLLVISNIPNGWSEVFGDSFKFLYFVGNPSGPHKYSDVSTEKIPIK